jgi:diaminopimelate epimerase
MKDKIDFIKGHMGGNKILLLDGDQINREKLLPTALHALDELALSGHQAGILFPPERGGTVRVRIVSICGRDFIGACGGLTQVLSRALVETELGERYKPDYQDNVCQINIEFDQINVETSVALNEGKFVEVNTDFSAFAHEILLRGIERIDLGGLEAWRVGYFFVIDADKVKEKYPEVNFEIMDGATKEIITLLQYRFLGATGITSWDSAFYDHNPTNGSDLRAFFPHNVRIGYVEPSCGTGSIALALAFSTNGEKKIIGTESNGQYIVKLETGGKPTISGVDHTKVVIERSYDIFKRAVFSNSNVQLVASGILSI